MIKSYRHLSTSTETFTHDRFDSIQLSDQWMMLTCSCPCRYSTRHCPYYQANVAATCTWLDQPTHFSQRSGKTQMTVICKLQYLHTLRQELKTWSLFRSRYSTICTWLLWLLPFFRNIPPLTAVKLRAYPKFHCQHPAVKYYNVLQNRSLKYIPNGTHIIRHNRNVVKIK